ncbi:OAM dimerization domain-containing protein [Liberiplasma polymorphum]|uniref:lysine 5,6-aminomutase subunit beta n=1 Tax=Liberiplasma polymorphum TaxID=3374570 RepID=UPI0037742F87
MKNNLIRPYGDTLNDGLVQVSFTLPLPCDAMGEETAKAFALKMGLQNPSVVHATPLSDAFSYYIIYGTLIHQIDPSHIKVTEVEHGAMTKEEVEQFIENNFKKPLVFIGASTGTDAHTVGIDAIMNMKGFAGNYGLERYKGIKAINLGSQVDNETLLEEAIKHQADVILISQTVTQKDVHIQNLTEFIELLEAEEKRDDFIVIIGGARINHSLAKELGYDAGFGPKKYAYDVASFAVQALFEKQKK